MNVQEVENQLHWGYSIYDSTANISEKSVRNFVTHLDSIRTFHQVVGAAVAPRIGASKSAHEHSHLNLYNLNFITPASVTLVSECESCAHGSHLDTNVTLAGVMKLR